MSKHITSLEDARALKAAGWPLNMEVNHRELPKHCDKLIESVMKAAIACRDAVYAYLTNQNASTYSKLKRTHEKLGRELAKIPAPVWIEDADGYQLTNPDDAFVAAVVGPRCFTAFARWAAVIAELENGNEVTLRFASADDVWPTEVPQEP
jgi:hypothetical protein